jgi:hypothetical protein
MVLSRCPCRFCRAAAISATTSCSVRYSRERRGLEPLFSPQRETQFDLSRFALNSSIACVSFSFVRLYSSGASFRSLCGCRYGLSAAERDAILHSILLELAECNKQRVPHRQRGQRLPRHASLSVRCRLCELLRSRFAELGGCLLGSQLAQVVGRESSLRQAPWSSIAGRLRARRERPRGCRAAEQRDELAPSHSITSSARASRLSGTV